MKCIIPDTFVSTGIFYSSTSYLPSAVCSSLLVLSMSSLLRSRFVVTISLGCIAVLWTGWPFVGTPCRYYSRTQRHKSMNTQTYAYKSSWDFLECILIVRIIIFASWCTYALRSLHAKGIKICWNTLREGHTCPYGYHNYFITCRFQDVQYEVNVLSYLTELLVNYKSLIFRMI